TRTRITDRPSPLPTPSDWSRPVRRDLEDLALDLPAELGEAFDVVRRRLALRRREGDIEIGPRVEEQIGDLVELVGRRALRDRDPADPRPLLDGRQVGLPVVGVEGRGIGRLPHVHHRHLDHARRLSAARAARSRVNPLRGHLTSVPGSHEGGGGNPARRATSRGLRHDGDVPAVSLDDIPPVRIRVVGAAPVAATGVYVLYWMTAARRTGSSFALDRAVAWARELGKPLVVLEAIRLGYRWASERLHRFVLEGMADNARRLSSRRALYYPYVEPTRGAGRGLLESLAARAAVVVTDDFPCFFVPRMLEAAGRRLRVRLEAVDGNGLLPMRASSQVFTTAFAFRRFLQRSLPAHLG